MRDRGRRIEVWTDGGYAPATRCAGWGIVVREGERTAEHSGARWHSSSRRIEMKAVAEALMRTPRDAAVVVRCDQMQFVGAMCGERAIRNTRGGLGEVLELARGRATGWIYEPRCSSEQGRRADQLASAARRELEEQGGLSWEERARRYCEELAWRAGAEYPVEDLYLEATRGGQRRIGRTVNKELARTGMLRQIRELAEAERERRLERGAGGTARYIERRVGEGKPVRKAWNRLRGKSGEHERRVRAKLGVQAAAAVKEEETRHERYMTTGELGEGGRNE